MTKNLVIVESPSKSKTIEKYLGKDYKVVSSKGHIRDLATTGKYGLGVDVDNDFKPNYIPVAGKKKLISELKKLVKDSDEVILATDPDREGEAISWHLLDTLGIKDTNYERVLFHEITKDKVLEAIKNPTKIDYNLVRSQETRRILDRIIGFRLSKLMQSKTGGKSAGRVQSVALKLIVDREREISSFNSEEYWTITSKFDEIEADLFNYNHKDIEINTEEEADSILSKLSDKYKIESVESKKKSKKSKPPFITSTLQQEASTKLGFTAKKTMSIAQKLYEGMDIGSETVGLITYMRTDSIRLSDEFIGASYKYIEENYGKDYIGYAKKSKKTENVQDAHEAIRPTSVYRNPEDIKKYLSTDEYKLYKIIYYRALASLMADAKVEATSVILDNNNYQFKINGQILIYDGYLKAYALYETSEDKVLPDEFKNEGSILTTTDVTKKQHFTSPPPRYTEAKLIKELEELGIGRPSTYAKIMDTIKERGYVTIEEKKFVPTEIGIETTDRLQEFFSDLINVKYTAAMETDLDTIALGKLDEIKVLREFYDKFEPEVEKAFGQMEKKAPKETGEVCPNCGSSLVIRKGRYGEFTACSNYPECKYIKKEEKQVKEIMDCPKCGGKIIEKKTKRGKIFYGCNNYPKCKYASWDKPTGNLCKECGEPLVEKNGSETCPNCNK
ncbi:MAG: type I DNA topoisomerase [Bacilli bacterium]|nr:type I DNA topoisomerase [Clostridium sp.]MDY6015301.1 type I DNA topoisomerase [Bacilli bacterium]